MRYISAMVNEDHYITDAPSLAGTAPIDHVTLWVAVRSGRCPPPLVESARPPLTSRLLVPVKTHSLETKLFGIVHLSGIRQRILDKTRQACSSLRVVWPTSADIRNSGRYIRSPTGGSHWRLYLEGCRRSRLPISCDRVVLPCISARSTLQGLCQT